MGTDPILKERNSLAAKAGLCYNWAGWLKMVRAWYIDREVEELPTVLT